MNLYILREEECERYDTYDGFVIAANSEEQAKQMAHEQDRGRGRGEHQPWVTDSTCELLSAVDGEARIILGSFNAG